MSKTVCKTAAGRFTLVDSEQLGVAFRYTWIETADGASQQIAQFALFCDAYDAGPYFQSREDGALRLAQARGFRIAS